MIPPIFLKCLFLELCAVVELLILYIPTIYTPILTENPPILSTMDTNDFVDNGHQRDCKRESRSDDIFRLSVVLWWVVGASPALAYGILGT
jgi:hypothetical protein